MQHPRSYCCEKRKSTATCNLFDRLGKINSYTRILSTANFAMYLVYLTAVLSINKNNSIFLRAFHFILLSTLYNNNIIDNKIDRGENIMMKN